MKGILIIFTFTLIFAITAITFGIAYAGGIRGIGLMGVCFFLYRRGDRGLLAQWIPPGIVLSSFVGNRILILYKGRDAYSGDIARGGF
jgi:hypothetical protein